MLSETEINRILVVDRASRRRRLRRRRDVARFTDAGIEVTYCIATDGDAGGFDRELDNGGMAALRRTEQTDAAKAVGVTDLRFLGYQDGDAGADASTCGATSAG